MFITQWGYFVVFSFKLKALTFFQVTAQALQNALNNKRLKNRIFINNNNSPSVTTKRFSPRFAVIANSKVSAHLLQNFLHSILKHYFWLPTRIQICCNLSHAPTH
jgi:hypothetical protein